MPKRWFHLKMLQESGILSKKLNRNFKPILNPVPKKVSDFCLSMIVKIRYSGMKIAIYSDCLINFS